MLVFLQFFQQGISSFFIRNPFCRLKTAKKARGNHRLYDADRKISDISVNRNSDGSLDLAGAQATGANIHGLGRPIHDHANMLRIGRGVAARALLGVRDVVAGHGALRTYFTDFSHGKTPPFR